MIVILNGYRAFSGDDISFIRVDWLNLRVDDVLAVAQWRYGPQFKVVGRATDRSWRGYGYQADSIASLLGGLLRKRFTTGYTPVARLNGSGYDGELLGVADVNLVGHSGRPSLALLRGLVCQLDKDGWDQHALWGFSVPMPAEWPDMARQAVVTELLRHGSV